ARPPGRGRGGETWRAAGERSACGSPKRRWGGPAPRTASGSGRAVGAADPREPLIGAETSWEAMLPELCEASGEGYDEPDRAAYMRSRCMVDSTEERTRAMYAAHPECAPRQ